MVLHRILLGAHLHEPKAHTHIESEITDLQDYVKVIGDIMSGTLGVESDSADVGVYVDADSAEPLYEVQRMTMLKDRFKSQSLAGGLGEFFFNGLGIDLQGTYGDFAFTMLDADWLHVTTTAANGFMFEAEARFLENVDFRGDIQMQADQKIYGASGHIMAWYQSLDDSMNFGTNGDIVRLKGSALRPVYEQTPGVDKEIALLDDLTTLGVYVLTAGDTMTGDLIMDWGTALQVDIGALETPTDAVKGNSFGIVFGDASAAAQILGSVTRPTYNGAELALLSDIGGGPSGIFVQRDGTLELTANWDAGPYFIRATQFYADAPSPAAPLLVDSVVLCTNLNADLLDGEHASAFADASHTHLEADITDLQAYLTEAAADLLYSLLGHTHAYAPISHTHLEAHITDLGAYIEDITGEPLGDLSDVVITAVADNEVLAYDSGGNWINQTATEAGLAEASHTHLEADITDILHDAEKLQGDDIYASIAPSDGDMLAWDDGNSRWDAVDPAVKNAIFFGSSTTGATVTGGTTIVDWQETTGYRRDDGYTHQTGTDPDEITLNNVGWYLIVVDLGFLDSATDGETVYTLVVEQWNGSTWADIGNRGGTESGAWTWTKGGAGEPGGGFFSATNFFETVAANEKIRINLQVSSTATTPQAGLDDEKCRLYIERKHG